MEGEQNSVSKVHHRTPSKGTVTNRSVTRVETVSEVTWTTSMQPTTDVLGDLRLEEPTSFTRASRNFEVTSH